MQKINGMRVAIIGGGAAGFFAAINIKRFTPEAEVVIYEAAREPLSKVRVSGGGRCNLTNSFEGGEPLSKIYPRGERVMRNCFKIFDHSAAYAWFEECGVELTTQEDNCVFPRSQRSSEIIDTFMRLIHQSGVELKIEHSVERISRCGEGFSLSFKGGESVECDIVLATTGGSPKMEGLSLYEELPLRYKQTLPSLFSFKIPNNSITELMGTVVESATVLLKGSRMCGVGALLITHWGISGPAVLKLSSYAAQRLYESDYRADILINWCGTLSQEQVRAGVLEMIAQNSKKLVTSVAPYGLTSRAWLHILSRANISVERRFVELGSKGINRIVATLTADEYSISGRGVNREEFVTCGGVSTSTINPTTMESHDCPNLFFAGEVLDIDAITGGYNLQAAWSTAFVAACTIAERCS